VERNGLRTDENDPGPALSEIGPGVQNSKIKHTCSESSERGCTPQEKRERRGKGLFGKKTSKDPMARTLLARIKDRCELLPRNRSQSQRPNVMVRKRQQKGQKQTKNLRRELGKVSGYKQEQKLTNQMRSRRLAVTSLLNIR